MHSRGSASLVIILIHNSAVAAVSRVTNEACYCGCAYISLKFFGVDSTEISGIKACMWRTILINGDDGGDSPHPEITR